MSISAEEIDDIIYCSRVGNLEAIQGFFDQCGDDSLSVLENIRDSSTQNTPLHMAAGNGHVELVKYLVQFINKASEKQRKNIIDAKNDSGNTALHWAALNGQLESVKILCEEGQADPFAKNSNNHDAFYEADNNQQEPVIDYLLEKYSFDLGGSEQDGADESNETSPSDDSHLSKNVNELHLDDTK